MPTSLDLDAHGDGIGSAATVLRENARLAGVDAPVPTVPAWSVGDLVLHTGLVHRWADAILRGVPPETAGEIDLPVADAVRREAGFVGVEPFDWYDAQVTALLQTLAFAPPDLDVFFFLKDAPPARMAWARRQSHETTMHAVDAMAARLGRVPSVSEVWVRSPHAVDGIDELLTGFVPRRKQTLRSDAPWLLPVEATDTGHAWRLEISEDPVMTTVLPPTADRPTTACRGAAVPRCRCAALSHPVEPRRRRLGCGDLRPSGAGAVALADARHLSGSALHGRGRPWSGSDGAPPQRERPEAQREHDEPEDDEQVAAGLPGVRGGAGDRGHGLHGIRQGQHV